MLSHNDGSVENEMSPIFNTIMENEMSPVLISLHLYVGTTPKTKVTIETTNLMYLLFKMLIFQK